MTKNELCKEVAVSEGLLLSTTIKALDGIVRVISEAITKGEPVVLRGFGQFQVEDRAERKGHDFATGADIIIPAHKVVRFKPSMELRNSLNK